MTKQTACKYIVALFALGFSLIIPSPASADGWASLFVGSVFGGSTGAELVQAVENSSNTTYGFNLGGMSGGVFGAELDLGYTPKFFGSDSGVESSGVLTVMGNLVIGIPLGGQSGAGIRPYGTAGVGLLRRKVDFREAFGNLSTNDFGYNLGGGIMGFFTDVFGIRGEYRYFRNFSADGDEFPYFKGGTFNFSRASLGIIFRF